MFVEHLNKPLFLFLITLLLGSCTQGGRPPVHLRITSIDPEPVVGQVSSVTFTVTPDFNLSEATISTRFFDTALGYYPKAEPFWSGDLIANETQEFTWNICVLNSGRWQLDIDILATSPEGYGDGERRYIDSDYDSAEIKRQTEGPAEVTRLVTTIIPGGNSSANEDAYASSGEPVFNVSSECLATHTQP